ncbi:hypothetical protein [Cohaesibacter intestini]|uniref:hypothetical protein n=1 Tax=Cohaesibacter intestini TaxID=2211145 RepID=UPI0013005CEF|nr:hypothetical protein [Cohaesibacter intestini]
MNSEPTAQDLPVIGMGKSEGAPPQTWAGRLKALLWAQRPTRFPEGPEPGPASGPETHTTSIAFDASFDDLKVTCHFAYHFDPACTLSLLMDTEEGYHLFWFERRAYSLKHAFQALFNACQQADITVPVAGLHPRAQWQSSTRDCDCVRIPGAGEHHPCTLP